MDLSTLDLTAIADQGVEMQVRHPTTGELFEDMFITVKGTDSEAYRNALKGRIRKRQLGTKFRDTFDIDAEERAAIELIARLTLAWRGVVVDGEELTCTFENAIAVYRRFIWLREQVDEFIADRANFLAKA